MKLVKFSIIMFLIVLSTFSCTQNKELGSKGNPITMYFVPSMEAGKIVTSGEQLTEYLSEKTGYHFDVSVPTSYAAVIEAMGTEEADIAWLATFAYILAHEKYGAEVALTTVRKGLQSYRGQFIALAESDIDSLEDIEGKTIAYTDFASTSGYIYPSALLAKKGIEPENVLRAGGHPQAVMAVYQKRADVGCTYWSPENEEGPQDARAAVVETYPDIFEKTKIVGFTDWIPNDTVTFRKNFPPEMKKKIVDVLLEFVSTEEGRETMDELYSIDGFVRATDADYDVVRNTLETLGVSAEEYIE